MASYLTFLQLCNLRKPYTVLERVEPFEDLDEEEFSSLLLHIFTANSIHELIKWPRCDRQAGWLVLALINIHDVFLR